MRPGLSAHQPAAENRPSASLWYCLEQGGDHVVECRRIQASARFWHTHELGKEILVLEGVFNRIH